MMSRLPVGLDPVTAGRFGLWLLGQWQHARAIQRKLAPSAYTRACLADYALAELFPWKVEEYPGRNRAFGYILGISPETARQYASGRRKLPPKHAIRLADYLDEKQKRIADLVIRLREHAAAAQPGISRRRLERLAVAHEKQRLAYVKKVKARQEEALAESEAINPSMPE